MKRKGRKSKSNENSANGLGDRQDQNGDASERDDEDSGEPEDKRRKSNKRKSAAKKVEEEAEEPQYEVSGVKKKMLAPFSLVNFCKNWPPCCFGNTKGLPTMFAC
jgi:hypothetical protein